MNPHRVPRILLILVPIAVLVITATTVLTAPTAAAATRFPVLLVHGAIGSSRNFDTMAARLRDDGYLPFTIDLPFPATDSVADARLIAERVAQIRAETGATKVHLVAQSLGGIAARYYLRQLGGLPHLATYTAIGTAQHGISSPVSCVLISDTCPSGPVMRAINTGDDTPGTILYTSIGSTETRDEADGTRTRLDGGACLPQVAGGQHAGEPSDPVVHAAVVRALESYCPPGQYADLPDIGP